MDNMEVEWRAHGMQIWQIKADAEKNHQETLTTTNQIEEAILKNNWIFAKKWEETQDWIDCWADENQQLKTYVFELKSLSSLL